MFPKPTQRIRATLSKLSWVACGRYAQHYSADGFSAAASKTIDSDYWMEGIAIARKATDGSRKHIFAAAVGLNYDESQTA
jgi:hypothetical protein